MIEITRRLAMQLRPVFRQALNLSTRGILPPLTFQAGPDGLRVRSRLHDAAVEYHVPGDYPVEQIPVPFELLSDSDMDAARAFGLAFKVDDALVETYKTQYGIDLEASSGRTHHELPVPAAYVVDQAGMIRFAFVNPDYKVRVDSEKLLDEARDRSVLAECQVAAIV